MYFSRDWKPVERWWVYGLYPAVKYPGDTGVLWAEVPRMGAVNDRLVVTMRRLGCRRLVAKSYPMTEAGLLEQFGERQWILGGRLLDCEELSRF